MRNYILAFFLFFLFGPDLVLGQEKIVIPDDKGISISQNLGILNDPESQFSIQDVILKNAEFAKFTENQETPGDQWLKFTIYNSKEINHEIKVSIAFADYISCYVIQGDSIFTHKTGDLLPLKDRNYQIGQLCLVGFQVPAKQTVECYLKLHSSTDISKQFRAISIRSVQVYSEKPFTRIFETSRIYQALFFWSHYHDGSL